MRYQLSQNDKDNLRKTRILVFQQDENLLTHLETIQHHVENIWAEDPGLPWHTFHDESHNLKVEAMVYRVIPADKYDLLTPREWFVLLASTWLHDVGMMLNLDLEGARTIRKPSEEDIKKIRDTHHERSFQYIREHRQELGLEPADAQIIARVCQYHRKQMPIATCEDLSKNIRVRLLAAYLRLADALHIDSTRVEEAQFRLLLAIGMPWESRFHWLKSKWVQNIQPEPENLRIYVEVFDTPEKSLTKGLLRRLVRDEIREELESVRDVLIRGGISFFLDVEVRNVGEPFDPRDCTELEMTLSNIQLENLSSASEVADAIVKTVIRLAESETQTLEPIQDYMTEIQAVLQARPCHVLIQGVVDTIQRILEDPALATDEQRVELIRVKLEKLKKRRDEIISKLAQNAAPFLSDGTSVLLFGYSTLVLQALDSVPPDVKQRMPVYVGECRGKTQYNYKNEISYCDGLSYARKVNEAGFTKVYIVPDICIGNLMRRKLINKVFFGANGVGPDGTFGHTAGHLTIADSARTYGVPVYVVADTSKFGSWEWDEELERDVQWLTRDRSSLDQIERFGIKLLNPREDLVEPSKITMLITEIGVFPPWRIPEGI